MIIGRPQRTNRSTYPSRCILAVFTVASLSTAACAQQTAATPEAPTFRAFAPTKPTPAPAAQGTDAASSPQRPPAAVVPPGALLSQPVVRPAVGAETQTDRPQIGGEGIKVHGHWKIVVHNPDGTFVKQTEFDNSLVTPNSADAVLSEMMSGAFTLAGWQVAVDSSTSTALCPGTGYFGNINSCFLVVANPSIVNPANLITYNQCYLVDCFAGMTTTYVPYNSTTKASAYFQLLGNFIPVASGPITAVRTTIIGCVANSGVSAVTVNQCLTQGDYGSGNGYTGAPDGTTFVDPTFTATTLPTPLNVTAGQVVTVIVTISFS